MKLYSFKSFKYLKENNSLTYDDLDLTTFTNRYIVGRWFETKEDANSYLKSIIDKSNNKIDDFNIVKDDKDTSLKPYRILPKPSDKEKRR